VVVWGIERRKGMVVRETERPSRYEGESDESERVRIGTPELLPCMGGEEDAGLGVGEVGDGVVGARGKCVGAELERVEGLTPPEGEVMGGSGFFDSLRSWKRW